MKKRRNISFHPGTPALHLIGFYRIENALTAFWCDIPQTKVAETPHLYGPCLSHNSRNSALRRPNAVCLRVPPTIPQSIHS